jgi:hypothetical protein
LAAALPATNALPLASIVNGNLNLTHLCAEPATWN